VRLQLHVAGGGKIPFAQGELKINGHAIESRVYAEDPANNFLPDIGKLETYVRPQGQGIRVDDGFEQGMTIPFYYDPMIAKLICHAETRDLAIEKTIRAINEYRITGLETTLGFCKFVMLHDAFRSGRFDTKFVEKHFQPDALKSKAVNSEETLAVALSAMQSTHAQSINVNGDGSAHNESVSKWKGNRSGPRTIKSQT
jgi:propionyl-CoA carboxylase alpha chain